MHLDRVGLYKLGKTIGQGTYGKVKLASHVETGEKAAIKIIEKSQLQLRKNRDRLKREIKFLRLLNHPNIVKVYDVQEANGCIYIIMEYASGGELFDYIVAHVRVKEEEARCFFRQVLSAIDYCHKNAVIHRDLKPENLLLDDKKTIKIIDFGFGNNFNFDNLLETFCGSPFYAAPEMILGKKYEGPEVDLWSLGVILFALLCGHLPFDDENIKDLYRKIANGLYSCPDYISPKARHLIGRLIQVDPRSRATLPEVLHHPWVNEGYDTVPSSHMAFRPLIKDVSQLDQNVVAAMQSFGWKKETFEKEWLACQNLLRPCPMRATYWLIKEMRERKVNEDRKRQQYSKSNAPTANSREAQGYSNSATSVKRPQSYLLGKTDAAKVAIGRDTSTRSYHSRKNDGIRDGNDPNYSMVSNDGIARDKKDSQATAPFGDASNAPRRRRATEGAVAMERQINLARSVMSQSRTSADEESKIGKTHSASGKKVDENPIYRERQEFGSNIDPPPQSATSITGGKSRKNVSSYKADPPPSAAKLYLHKENKDDQIENNLPPRNKGNTAHNTFKNHSSSDSLVNEYIQQRRLYTDSQFSTNDKKNPYDKQQANMVEPIITSAGDGAPPKGPSTGLNDGKKSSAKASGAAENTDGVTGFNQDRDTAVGDGNAVNTGEISSEATSSSSCKLRARIGISTSSASSEHIAASSTTVMRGDISSSSASSSSGSAKVNSNRKATGASLRLFSAKAKAEKINLARVIPEMIFSQSKKNSNKDNDISARIPFGKKHVNRQYPDSKNDGELQRDEGARLQDERSVLQDQAATTTASSPFSKSQRNKDVTNHVPLFCRINPRRKSDNILRSNNARNEKSTPHVQNADDDSCGEKRLPHRVAGDDLDKDHIKSSTSKPLNLLPQISTGIDGKFGRSVIPFTSSDSTTPPPSADHQDAPEKFKQASRDIETSPSLRSINSGQNCSDRENESHRFPLPTATTPPITPNPGKRFSWFRRLSNSLKESYNNHSNN